MQPNTFFLIYDACKIKTEILWIIPTKPDSFISEQPFLLDKSIFLLLLLLNVNLKIQVRG